MCAVKEYTKKFVSWGACMSHGGRQKKRICAAKGCNKHAQRGRLFTGHQAWVKELTVAAMIFSTSLGGMDHSHTFLLFSDDEYKTFSGKHTIAASAWGT